jgi:hypothetical protein
MWQFLNLLRSFRQASFARKRGEARHLSVELQFDGASRPVTLFADDNFRLAVDFVCFGLPFAKVL